MWGPLSPAGSRAAHRWITAHRVRTSGSSGPDPTAGPNPSARPDPTAGPDPAARPDPTTGPDPAARPNEVPGDRSRLGNLRHGHRHCQRCDQQQAEDDQKYLCFVTHGFPLQSSVVAYGNRNVSRMQSKAGVPIRSNRSIVFPLSIISRLLDQKIPEGFAA